MKYIIIDSKNGDMFTEEFETREEAINAADRAWTYLTEKDKKRREAFYVLESVNPDPEAVDHYDGNLVKNYMED